MPRPGSRSVLGGLTLALAVVGSALATGPAALAAAPTACRVTDLATQRTFRALQPAVNRAVSPARLTVRGTCRGTTVIAGLRVSIRGVRSATSGAPTLSGGGTARVLDVRAGARVTIRSLFIRNGRVSGTEYPANSGAGVLLAGRLTLSDVVVRDNHAVGGSGGSGGIEVRGGARLVLAGSTQVRNNSGTYGGGIENYGTTIIRGSASVHHNAASATGGGIYNGSAEAGGLVLRDRARIHHNHATSGGGIAHAAGTLQMLGSALIDHNTADVSGGGIADNGDQLIGVSCGTNVKANSPDQVAPACPL